MRADIQLGNHPTYFSETISISKRQEAGRSSLLATQYRRKVTVDEPLTSYDRITTMSNRQRLRGLATASLMPSLRLIAVPPCSLSLLPDKAFHDRPVTCRLVRQSTVRDSDNPPSCVVSLSQTRPAGTGQRYLLL